MSPFLQRVQYREICPVSLHFANKQGNKKQQQILCLYWFALFKKMMIKHKAAVYSCESVMSLYDKL